MELGDLEATPGSAGPVGGSFSDQDPVLGCLIRSDSTGCLKGHICFVSVWEMEKEEGHILLRIKIGASHMSVITKQQASDFQPFYTMAWHQLGSLLDYMRLSVKQT